MENHIPVIVVTSGLIIFCFLLDFIEKLIESRKYHKQLASSGIRDIDKLDGLQFEFYLRALLKELGYSSIVTKGSNDFGADLILKKGSEKIVIQAKRYKYKSNIGVEAVQQIYTAIPYYKADRGWIITNSNYTKSAIKLADVCNIRLIGRKELVKLISKANPTVTPHKIKRAIQPKERKCPVCKNVLVVRESKQGNNFFGCSKYPVCKHTEPIAN